MAYHIHIKRLACFYGAVLAVFIAACGGVRQQPASAGSPGAGQGPCAKVYRCTPAQLDVFLNNLSRNHTFENRQKIIADSFVGAPYCEDPLENEQRNWLPYTKTNCTMFVLTASAFANSSSRREALRHMRMLHYRSGRVSFENRYHFTADRISDRENRYFSLATKKYVRSNACLRSVTLTLNRTRSGDFFFRGRLNGWTKKLTVSYVSRKGFSPDCLRPLPDILGIAFVKSANWDKGIIIGHEGILINKALYHASPGIGVHVDEGYLDRLFTASCWDGFVLFSFEPAH